MLHPELFPDRESWCAARHADAVDQLASSPADLSKVLVNHSSARGAARRAAAHPPLHPLVRDPKDSQLAPPVQSVGRRLRPSPHPGGHWLDGVPFQETSLGHSGQWDRCRGVGPYLRQVLLAPREASVRYRFGAPVWWSPRREGPGSLILHVDLRSRPASEQRAFSLLDSDERARWSRFRVEGARRQFALCRAALRIHLCKRLGCSNEDPSFGQLEHGKPFIREGGVASDANFNVSHRGEHGLIGFAAGAGATLEVDMEVCAAGRDFDGIGDRVYGPRERGVLSGMAGEAKTALFNRLWTLKEAFIEALRTGFSLDPSRFEAPRPMLEGERSAVFRFPHRPFGSF